MACLSWKKDSLPWHLPWTHSIGAVLSGSFIFTFYIQQAQFICLLSQTVYTRANTFLPASIYLLWMVNLRKIGSVFCLTLVLYLGSGFSRGPILGVRCWPVVAQQLEEQGSKVSGVCFFSGVRIGFRVRLIEKAIWRSHFKLANSKFHSFPYLRKILGNNINIQVKTLANKFLQKSVNIT